MFPPPALILFDIDGTLVRKAGPHHRLALEVAARQVTGLSATTDGIPTQGMLDRDILTIMLQASGASKRLIRDSMPELMRVAQNVYSRQCPADLSKKVCPGARMLLYKLYRKRLPTGLVTGNLSRIAWKKMERAGLKQYLRFGAFAELADTRAGLVKIAIDEARRRKWIGPQTLISLIGDHPNDILAAKANGVRSIAVATGVVPGAELATHQPDLLIDDMRQLHPETLLKA